MTYHSSKGLDFDNVFLPFLSSTCNIFDETLFMVGLTRSKLNLTISYTDTMHKFVKDIENDCVLVDIDMIYKKNNDILDLDF
jgi:superfamily I DNA/RNA helicase